jgi:hypothetical protein
MGEVTSRALLIDASTFGARTQIAATIPREDIEETLRLQEPPELVLDIDRRSNGDVEGHTLRVAWTEDQLEELLRDTSGEEITLFFDADELEQSLVGGDIEAHGVRETTAAVLTVAAVAAGIGAAAHPASAAVGGSGTIEMVSDAASSGVAAAPELISDSASGGGVQVAEASGPELVSDAASGGGVQVAEASGPELVSDAASTGTLSSAQSANLAGAVSVAGDDSGLSSSEIGAAAAGTGLVLLITGAAFTIRGKRQREQPA